MVGTTNDVVYPVHGGMEEWGYAGSWFNQYSDVKTVPTVCNEKRVPVVFSDCSNRCLTFLIETSDNKMPREAALGNNTDIWKLSFSSNEDYINILLRQSLVLMDVLIPYSIIQTASKQNDTIDVRWVVGGCFEVDSTQLWMVPVTPELKRLASSRGFMEADLTATDYAELHAMLMKSQPTYQSAVVKGSSPLRHKPRVSFRLSAHTNQMQFHARVPVPAEGSVLIAVSHVDGYMKKAPSARHPPVGPQSHYAQVHSNDSYVCSDAFSGREIRGRHTVLSRPFWIPGERRPTEPVKPSAKVIPPGVEEKPTLRVSNIQVKTETEQSSKVDLRDKAPVLHKQTRKQPSVDDYQLISLQEHTPDSFYLFLHLLLVYAFTILLFLVVYSVYDNKQINPINLNHPLYCSSHHLNPTDQHASQAIHYHYPIPTHPQASPPCGESEESE